MANDTYVLFSYTVEDRFGTKTQTVMPAYVDGGAATLANLKTQWVTGGGDLDAIIDGIITGGKVSIVLPPDGGWATSPGSDSFTERTAVFNFKNPTTKYKYGIKVPSLDNDTLANGKIDLTNTAIEAFITLLTSTFTHGEYVNPGLYALTALTDAFLAARKYRKQLDRSTYEV